MEGTRRERLTGAIIFFAVLAIAAPELFDGPGRGTRGGADKPADAGTPVTTYELVIDRAANAGGNEAQRSTPAVGPEQSEAIAQAVPPPVTGSQPAPADSGGTTDAPVASVTQARPQPQAPAVTPPAGAAPGSAPAPIPAESPQGAQVAAPAAARPAAASTAKGGWWVQLGAFASSENAQRLASETRAKGFTINVTKVRSGGRDLHAVRTGPAADREAALALQRRLAAAGAPKGELVAP